MAKVVLPVGDPLIFPKQERDGTRDLPEHELPIYEGFPVTEQNVRKGNLTPMSTLSPSHALTSPGAPFKNVRGGR